MESCYWCSTCCKLYLTNPQHDDHTVKHVGGTDNVDETLSALDDVIQYGLGVLKSNEKEVTVANEVSSLQLVRDIPSYR